MRIQKRVFETANDPINALDIDLIQSKLEKLEAQFLSDEQITEWQQLIESPEHCKDCMTLTNMRIYLEDHGYNEELITEFQNEFTIDLARLSMRNFEEAVEIHRRAKEVFRKARYTRLGERSGEISYEFSAKLLDRMECIFLYILKIKSRLMGHFEAQRSVFGSNQFSNLLNDYKNLHQVLSYVITSLSGLKERGILSERVDIQKIQERSHRILAKMSVQLKEFVQLSLFEGRLPSQIDVHPEMFVQSGLEREVWNYRCNVCLLHESSETSGNGWTTEQGCRYHQLCEQFFRSLMQTPLPTLNDSLSYKEN
jgi:hypothetical protein